MRLFAITTLALSFLVGPLAAEPSYERVNQALADAVILPAYERYADGMADLAPSIEALCVDPGEGTLAVAREAFARAMAGWQHAQPVAFGPVAEEGRTARIQFWPDKHGSAGRQLNKALAAEDPALIENGVADKSVALQSFASLERLLFGEPAGPSAYGCKLAEAIADFQNDLALTILADWKDEGGFHKSFTEAEGGNDLFYDAKEAHTALFKAINVNLDVIITQKLERPLGKQPDSAKRKRAESWRSGGSLDNIIANLETIEALYTAEGGLQVWLPAAGFDALDVTLRDVIEQALLEARDIDQPLAEAVGDAEGRPAVESLLSTVKRLRTLFGTTLADAADITIGFNASDGD
ncbi:MAG: imelysin family protein [Geminicoccaceae bacterium]